MKTKLRENNSNDLVVFLTGWGCDDNQFKNFSSSKNLLLCWDYCTLDFEFDFSKYNKVSLLAYSAGVLVACLEFISLFCRGFSCLFIKRKIS